MWFLKESTAWHSDIGSREQHSLILRLTEKMHDFLHEFDSGALPQMILLAENLKSGDSLKPLKKKETA